MPLSGVKKEVRAILAGAGALEALAGGGEGSVLAWFARACYVALPAGVVALVGPDVHPGPVHLVLDAPPPRVQADTPVRASASEIVVGGWRVPVVGVRPWRGRLPSPPEVRASAGGAVAALVPGTRRSLVPSGRARLALARARVGDLASAVRLLAGAGPGLTPAGDDVLGGLLFARRALEGAAAEPALVPLARSAETTLLSRAFLLWAARGQALAPAHALLAAAARRDGPAASGRARELASVGESSGADFAFGLAWGLREGG